MGFGEEGKNLSSKRFFPLPQVRAVLRKLCGQLLFSVPETCVFFAFCGKITLKNVFFCKKIVFKGKKSLSNNKLQLYC